MKECFVHGHTSLREKKCHEYEREQGNIYWVVWREERKWGNDVIDLQIQLNQAHGDSGTLD